MSFTIYKIRARKVCDSNPWDDVIHQISIDPTDHPEIHIGDRSRLETLRRAACSQVQSSHVHTCFDRQERGITLFDRDNRWIINQRQGRATSSWSTNTIDHHIEGIYLNQYKKHSQENPLVLFNCQKISQIKSIKPPEVKSIESLIHSLWRQNNPHQQTWGNPYSAPTHLSVKTITSRNTATRWRWWTLDQFKTAVGELSNDELRNGE